MAFKRNCFLSLIYSNYFRALNTVKTGKGCSFGYGANQSNFLQVLRFHPVVQKHEVKVTAPSL